MKFVFFANTDWYLFNFRLSTALELKARGHEVVMLSPPGEFGARFAEHGLRWVTLDMDRASLNPLRELVVLRDLVRILKGERPDLLHDFTIDELASQVAVSPSYLFRLFKKRMQVSPMQYRTMIRIDKAKLLLADQQLTVDEVASRVGFEDPKYFARVFRELTGTTPSAYRRSRLAD